MDWSNEPYVRVYTRETDDDLALTWDAISLWRAMLVRFDRSGLIQTKRGPRGLAAIVRCPFDVAERALPELLADGRVVEVADGYMAPNFMDAQEARKGDKLRQRESREKRRSGQLDGRRERPVTKPVESRDQSSRNQDETSHPVTAGHTASHDVTLCSADPLLYSAVRCVAPARAHAIPDPDPAPAPVPPTDVMAAAYDPENPALRGELGRQIWNRVDQARLALAAQIGATPERMPLWGNPSARARSHRDLQTRILEEGYDAPRICNLVVDELIRDATQKRSLDFLGEASFTEGSWRWARGRIGKPVPPKPPARRELDPNEEPPDPPTRFLDALLPRESS